MLGFTLRGDAAQRAVYVRRIAGVIMMLVAVCGFPYAMQEVGWVRDTGGSGKFITVTVTSPDNTTGASEEVIVLRSSLNPDRDWILDLFKPWNTYMETHPPAFKGWSTWLFITTDLLFLANILFYIVSGVNKHTAYRGLAAYLLDLVSSLVFWMPDVEGCIPDAHSSDLSVYFSASASFYVAPSVGFFSRAIVFQLILIDGIRTFTFPCIDAKQRWIRNGWISLHWVTVWLYWLSMRHAHTIQVVMAIVVYYKLCAWFPSADCTIEDVPLLKRTNTKRSSKRRSKTNRAVAFAPRSDGSDSGGDSDIFKITDDALTGEEEDEEEYTPAPKIHVRNKPPPPPTPPLALPRVPSPVTVGPEIAEPETEEFSTLKRVADTYKVLERKQAIEVVETGTTGVREEDAKTFLESLGNTSTWDKTNEHPIAVTPRGAYRLPKEDADLLEQQDNSLVSDHESDTETPAPALP